MDIIDEESLLVCTLDICLSFFFALQFQTGESLIKEENMAETMTNEEVYDFIGELAIALYSKKIRISLGALRVILADKGRDYNNNRLVSARHTGGGRTRTPSSTTRSPTPIPTRTATSPGTREAERSRPAEMHDAGPASALHFASTDRRSKCRMNMSRQDSSSY